MSHASETGFVHTADGKIWYTKVLGGPGTPVLVLHGGPGTPHDYLENLSALSKDRTVVFYDQLGCGQSDRPNVPSLWQIERFVDELESVRQALKLSELHLFGSSWGTMLAVDYVLKHPGFAKSLVLASPCLSARRWQEDTKKLAASMGPEWNRRRELHEKAGTTSSKEYMELNFAFYENFICRLKPMPGALQRSFKNVGANVYRTMWGASEFFMTGNLKNYDRTEDLKNIRLPVLFTCGRFDEATPDSTLFYASKMPNANAVIFENSAHLPHLEEPETYLKTLASFLQSVEIQT